MKKALIASAIVALGAIAAVVVAQEAVAQRPAPPGAYQRQGQFGFFAASQPANSTHVGIFIASRTPGEQPELFYCSSPEDAASKDPASCRKIPFPK
jgi:hypothetical protein